MANPNPIIRNEEQELLRQISFNKTLLDKVPTKAEKLAEKFVEESTKKYDERIGKLEAQLAEIKSQTV
jgi:hypothetical protein